MKSFKLRLQASLRKDEKSYNLQKLLDVLIVLEQTANLQQAAQQVDCSYRTAWNTLKQFEALLGCPLVNMQKGRGSEISDAGKTLLNAFQQQQLNVQTAMQHAEKAFNEQLLGVFGDMTEDLNIVASDSSVLNQLRETDYPVSLQIEGSQAALSSYAQGHCQLAGFHLAQGSSQQWLRYQPYFSAQDQFVLLELRQQGLYSRHENPVTNLQQLVREQRTFVNRQAGSGTRLLLDELLQQHGIAPTDIRGYCHEEHTHLAVAGLVASGQSDVGLGVKSAADRFKLNFSVLMNEHYYLVFKQRSPLIEQVLQHVLPAYAERLMSYHQFKAFFLGEAQ